MFTGIVRGVGRIAEQSEVGGDRRLQIDTRDVPLPPLEPGDSIAVNGVCLTVTTCQAHAFEADVSLETLSVTTLGKLSPGDEVNLEPSLRLGDSLDGHMVSGHVDGVGRIVAVTAAGRSHVITIEAPPSLAPYIARKGSVAVDGVSLTVNAVSGPRFEVNIVPHTGEMTIIDGYQAGTAVNIEVDIIARYVERVLTAPKDIPETP